MRRADRLFQIVQHLRARRLTTAAQLAAFLAVSERTIYRDIRDLSLSSIPIKGEAGVGYCLDRSFELTALMFTPDEVEAVVVGLRMAQAFAGPRLRDAATPALDKVILALPKHRRAEIDRPQIYAPAVHSDRELDPLRESLNVAIHRKAVVNLKYASDDAQTSRAVHPLALHFWGSVWTLAAWCRLRQDFRNFRLDRITGYLATEEIFLDEPGRSLSDFLDKVGVRRTLVNQRLSEVKKYLLQQTLVLPRLNNIPKFRAVPVGYLPCTNAKRKSFSAPQPPGGPWDQNPHSSPAPKGNSK